LVNEGRSAAFGLPEVDFGFQPELLQKLPETRRSDLASSEVIAGLDSTSPVKGRIEELRKLLAEVEEEQKGQLEPGRKAQSSASSSGTVDALKRVTETRWKAFAEGLGLSSKRALETLEVLDGSLFYVPYFIAKFARGSETRY